MLKIRINANNNLKKKLILKSNQPINNSVVINNTALLLGSKEVKEKFRKNKHSYIFQYFGLY